MEAGEEETGATWRDELGRRVALAVLVLAVTTLIVSLLRVGSEPGKIWLPIATGGLIAAVGFAARRTTPAQVRGVILVGAFLVASGLSYLRYGIMPGPALLLAAAVVFAGLLLGRRAMYVVLAIGALQVAVIATLMAGHTIPAPPLTEYAPTLAGPWLRTTIFTALYITVLGVGVTYAVDHIEDAGARAEREAERRRAAERKLLEGQQIELLGQLAGGLAHDVNNHLAVVSIWSGILASLHRDPAAQEATEEITNAVRLATTLTRRLLVLGRRGVHNPRPLSLAALVSEHGNTVRRITTAEVTFELASGPDDAWCSADPDQLQQVLLSLVMNARDAMPSGGHLTVRAGRRDHLGRPHAFLDIVDDGIGMSEEVLRHAREPFFTTKPPGKGSGLGLATVDAVARRHDGELVIESRVGAGTRVTLLLPEVPAVADPRSSDRVAPITALRARVLLAEDLPQLLRATRSVLERVGCTVIAVADGDEALAQIASDHFDLFCTDAVMPGRPTRELIDEFARRNPDAPILMCSGHVPEELDRRGIEQGRFAFLAKPYSAERLIAEVATLLSARPKPAADG